VKWIRLWTQEVVFGTTFQELDTGERGVWFSLLVLAGLPPSEGIVEMRKEVAWSIDGLSEFINCEVDYLKKAIEKLASEEINKIAILPDGRIKITKWEQYQTEYEKYRKGKNISKKNKVVKNLDNTPKDSPSSSPSSSSSESFSKKDIEKQQEDKVYEKWQEQKVVVHTEFRDDIRTKVRAAINKFGLDKVLKTILIYGTLYHGEKYFFSYKWTLDEFCKRGIRKWSDMTVDEALKNGLKPEHKKAPKPRNYKDVPEELLGGKK